MNRLPLPKLLYRPFPRLEVLARFTAYEKPREARGITKDSSDEQLDIIPVKKAHQPALGDYYLNGKDDEDCRTFAENQAEL